MKRTFKKLLFVLSLIVLLVQPSLALANDNEMKRQLEEILKARDEMMKMLLDDTLSGEVERRMDEMLRRLGQGSLVGEGLSGNETWSESETHKILTLKIKQVKDTPLDIKIQNGQISIKGSSETVRNIGGRESKSISQFQRSYSLPDDVDQDNPEFENKENEIVVKFKKIAAASSKQIPAKKVPSNNIPSDRRPVGPGDTDLSL